MPEPVEASTPLVTPPQIETPAPDDSLAAHSAQFGPGAEKATPDPVTEPTNGNGAPKERHRAQSQKATAADVPRINELTKKLRAAEAELERMRASRPAPAPPAPVTPPPPTPQSAAAPPPPRDGFSDPEPTLEQFTDKPDPYAAWQRALSAYDRKKERWEEQQTQKTEAATAAAAEAKRQADAEDHTRLTAYQGRLSEFVKTHPDFSERHAAVAASDGQLPPILERALMEDDNGPAILYHLLTHPDEYDKVRIEGYALPQTLNSVAILRRRLAPFAQQAATTGSAASAASITLPRPPNPVRTGPMNTGDDPPGDASSVADHERYYGQKRRR